MTRALLLLVALAPACTGTLGPGAPDDPDGDGTPGGPPPELATPPSCDGVPALGACTGPAELTRCVDGVVRRTETCPNDATCHIVNGAAACLGAELCSGVGPLGRCEGETLYRCDGDLAVTDCGAAGTVCAYQSDDVGYGCVPAAGAGAHRLTGVIRYEDKDSRPGEYGPLTPTLARGVTVSLLDDATDTVLYTVATADDGSYVVRYDATATVRAVVYTRSRAAVRPARIRRENGNLHGFGGDPFAPGAVQTLDLTVTASSGVGAAMSALDAAVRGMDFLGAHGVTSFAPLYIYWQSGAGGGSYYDGSQNYLHLDGDDGYDDVVVLHEFGHYTQDEYSASDNPGGAHDGSPADPRLAWGEGGATWLATAVRGVPYYIDGSAGGGWYVELEDTIHDASMSSSMSQAISEWMVAEVMWDVSDGALDGDGDEMSAGDPRLVVDVLLGYLVSPSRSDRGVSGVDLVDWLDGWFVHHGTADCGAMTALVNGRFEFPYDFNAPSASCP